MKRLPPTFIGHLRASLQIHFAVSLGSHFVDLIAQIVATVLPAAQTQPLLKGFPCVAAIGQAWLVFVQEGVDEEVDGAFVRALHQLIHIFEGR